MARTRLILVATFDYLGVGQTVTTQVTYTITDGTATDSATVTVTVTGTNDAPTASGTVADQTNVDSTTIAPFDVSGFFGDVDTGDSISFTSTTLPPGLSINATTGVITGSLPANASDGGPYSVTIVGTDISGATATQTFTWTVTNPAPTATDDALSGTENASLSGNVISDDNGSGFDSDPDGDALTVSLVNGLLANVGGNVTGTSGGTFNIAADGSYTFNPGSDFDYLGSRPDGHDAGDLHDHRRIGNGYRDCDRDRDRHQRRSNDDWYDCGPDERRCDDDCSAGRQQFLR